MRLLRGIGTTKKGGGCGCLSHETAAKTRKRAGASTKLAHQRPKLPTSPRRLSSLPSMIEDDELRSACIASRGEHEERRSRPRLVSLACITSATCCARASGPPRLRLALTQVAYLYTLPLMRPMATRFIHSVQQSSVFHAAQHDVCGGRHRPVARRGGARHGRGLGAVDRVALTTPGDAGGGRRRRRASASRLPAVGSRCPPGASARVGR